MNAPLPLIPDNAPFSPAQRSWLNGFLAGLYGGIAAGAAPPAPEPAPEPWHDPALTLAERMALAEGRALAPRLMAAMGQLDCGQCGYLCHSYAEALASGAETSAALCVPGGKATMRMVKALLAATPPAVKSPPAVERPPGRPVRVASVERLTGAGSSKDVRHVVIDLAGSGLQYEPGDSISLAVPNDPALVAATLAALGADATVPARCADGVERPIGEAFLTQCDIARPLDRVLDLLAMSARHPGHAASLRRLAEGEEGVAPQDADLLDLLAAFPSARPPLADLAAALPPLRPRLYSIASSPRAHPDACHLCVAVVRETRRGRLREGVASGFLAARAPEFGPIQAQIQSSHFRLPPDPATPVIMVGPGTGIAPFRAFLQDRAARGIGGRSWLFFGERNAASDFLYADELSAWRRSGVLGRLDVAFSRDQGRKIYVQHRMLENAPDLWRWLQDGAHVYVCGDAQRMALDVDAALRRIAMSEGRLDEAQAKDWIVALARQGRYLRDIY
jgi:sulfite reductase (NADPH) flavoprotein alpha-component